MADNILKEIGGVRRTPEERRQEDLQEALQWLKVGRTVIVQIDYTGDDRVRQVVGPYVLESVTVDGERLGVNIEPCLCFGNFTHIVRGANEIHCAVDAEITRRRVWRVIPLANLIETAKRVDVAKLRTELSQRKES